MAKLNLNTMGPGVSLTGCPANGERIELNDASNHLANPEPTEGYPGEPATTPPTTPSYYLEPPNDRSGVIPLVDPATDLIDTEAFIKEAFGQANGRGLVQVYRTMADGMRQSPLQLQRRAMVATIGTVFPEVVDVAVVNPKGGAGKTTVSFLIGIPLARTRLDGGVFIIESNPGMGTPGHRIQLTTQKTWVDLIENRGRIRRATDLNHYVNITSDGLRVLTGPRAGRGTAAIAASIDGPKWDLACGVVEPYASIRIADTGNVTGHPVNDAVFQRCRQIVAVAEPDESVSLVLESLNSIVLDRCRPELKRRAIVVVNQTRSYSGSDVRHCVDSFRRAGHEVFVIKRDPALAGNKPIVWEQIKWSNRRTSMRLAAAVVAGLQRSLYDPFNSLVD